MDTASFWAQIGSVEGDVSFALSESEDEGGLNLWVHSFDVYMGFKPIYHSFL